MSSLPPIPPPNPRSPFVWLRNKFLAGVAVALPLLITFWILQSAYHLLHGWSVPVVDFIARFINELTGRIIVDPSSPTYQHVLTFVGFLIPLMVFLALGAMATNVLGVRVVMAMDKLLLSVPIVSFIYKSLKQVIDGFKGLGGRQNFKRVVYVDYPSGDMKMLGFVTGQYLDPQQNKVLAAVFIPGALSPMTGLLLVVPIEQVTDAPLTVEDAMKLIFSGGLIVPSSLAAPASKPDISPAPLPVAEEAHEPESEPDLPVGLPRAEDFDSGDPDILSDSEVEAAELAGTHSPGRRILSALSWRKK
ncbi:DUF502 domain-containing protein [Prosthecobacter dejongeii]|uniref:Putative membrane protein n=1 Tax=Prosthecobacter dejongeii TaxID=48465 RepID=A0A7W7YNB6_9BACT|nr:DUF502 domain-containing protein [Prosthecobacter dejongeii]MBB5039353.1 putative membrane protein [Prosthecobacter dejongeii]